jgi:hypothetical protein
MKALLKISLILINFFLVHFVHAQDIQEERIIELSNVNAIQLNGKENVSFIQQVGNQNNANIIQTNPVRNAAMILQSGNQNFLMLSQQGSNLSINSGQSGNNNQGNISSYGDNININSTQTGNRNIINAYVENLGLMTRSALLEQSGNNNEINLEFLNGNFLNSGGLESVKVSQTGNQQGLNLRLDNAITPVEVIQTPGSGGQGMQVNIVTSAFPVK